MKIVSLQAENFKRLKAVNISPDGNIVTIGGNNGEGKTSVLDAVWVALEGRAAAPPKPIRIGEEMCVIKLDLGDVKITRTFRDKEGENRFTDTVKVENAEGLKYPSPQEMLGGLLGSIGFDPLEFARMKPADQADKLRSLVPLSVDLDELQEEDDADRLKRRDVNRDVVSLQSRIASIPDIEGLPKEKIDVDALANQIGEAANHNIAIETEKRRRDGLSGGIEDMRADNENTLKTIDELNDRITMLNETVSGTNLDITVAEKAIGKLPALNEPKNADDIRVKLGEANSKNERIADRDRKADLNKDLTAKQAESEAFTAAMAERDKTRAKALQEAEMPIEGLSFSSDEKGKPIVIYKGVPFEQISTAEQIRASTAIAMAGNPELRVLRIKDAAFLDKNSMKIIADMADDQDWQIWLERVGDGGVGIIMEDGEVKHNYADDKPSQEPETVDRDNDKLI